MEPLAKFDINLSSAADDEGFQDVLKLVRQVLPNWSNHELKAEVS